MFQGVATEPHCFLAYWNNDRDLLMECWARVENGSPITVVEAYRPSLDQPPKDPKSSRADLRIIGEPRVVR